MDVGDPNVPPKFGCEREMYPEFYKGVHGQKGREGGAEKRQRLPFESCV